MLRSIRVYWKFGNIFTKPDLEQAYIALKHLENLVSETKDINNINYQV